MSSAEMELLQGDWSIFLAYLSKKEEKYSTHASANQKFFTDMYNIHQVLTPFVSRLLLSHHFC